MQKEYDVLLVGAGLFNAVLCHEFVTKGKKVLVLEKRPFVGGNCHTYMENGVYIHEHGAHIFHTNKYSTWFYATQFADFDPFINSPIAMVTEKEDWVPYNLPFNMNTFSKLMHTASPNDVACLIEQETAIYKKDTYNNLEEKALSMVGPTIYEKFIKHYTEKQWGCPCTELSPDIITRIPLRFTYDNNYFNDRYQGIPSRGYTHWIGRMLKGATIMENTDYLAGRGHFDAMADHVFFSGRIDDFFHREYGELPYRSLRFETFTAPSITTQGVAVVNYPGSEVPYTRIIEHKYFMRPETYCSHPCYDPHYTIKTKEYPEQMSEGKEAYYPIVNASSKELYARYLAKCPANVTFTGRLGRFEYNDMDDTIEKALEVANQFLGSEQ